MLKLSDLSFSVIIKNNINLCGYQNVSYIYNLMDNIDIIELILYYDIYNYKIIKEYILNSKQEYYILNEHNNYYIEYKDKKIKLNRNTVKTFKDILNTIIGDAFCENFLIEHKYIVNWEYISKSQKLSESLIRKCKNVIDWNNISLYQLLSENFIRDFKNKVNWKYISYKQILSENFIREFKNRIYWKYISKYQELSEEFIIEFKKYIYCKYILKYQKLSKDTIILLTSRC
ncbi:tryptophan repeat gene family [Choristoneura biennis entomopoxvirus]|uniref:Tryptophan repeat gene family n=1 Tax=Choristoneura biennis entomopoxvirus TaxID=10288 RepID=A0A916KPB3_CBEPV|nr:tryptophan repeat gene family [Choristoneura biennis entomopoxvirus]CCU55607.1 tryptophan repeat gene family [Choristoneura biennis entomopoxvirus]